MTTPRTLIAALVALLVLGACAPTTLGTRNSPYDVDRDGPVAVRAGASVYVEASVAPSVFALTQADLASRLTPWGEGRARASITPLLEVRDVIAPDTWDVALERAVAYLDARRPEAQVDVMLRIAVPSDARPGGYRVRADVVDQRGRRTTIEVVVQVSL